MNARWGRWENMWAAEQVCVTRLLDRDTVMDKLVYVAANPVSDHLVEKACQWPGTTGYRLFLQRKPLRAHRPRHFFKDNGTMPDHDHVTLELVIPTELGQADAVVDELRQRVEAVEREMREERAKTGRALLGRRRVLAQSWRDAPTSIEPRRNLRPRFAGVREVRIRALLEYKAFLASYTDARRDWLTGKNVTFPVGTYWLAHFAPVRVAPLPS